MISPSDGKKKAWQRALGKVTPLQYGQYLLREAGYDAWAETLSRGVETVD